MINNQLICEVFIMKKRILCIKELKWQKMWKLWKHHKTITPLTELLTYENAMQIGGHLRFFNEATHDDIIYTTMVLKEYLPKEYYDNYIKSYLIFIDMKYNIKKGKVINEIQQENLFKETDEYYYKDESIMYKILLEFLVNI